MKKTGTRCLHSSALKWYARRKWSGRDSECSVRYHHIATLKYHLVRCWQRISVKESKEFWKENIGIRRDGVKTVACIKAFYLCSDALLERVWFSRIGCGVGAFEGHLWGKCIPHVLPNVNRAPNTISKTNFIQINLQISEIW